MNQTVLNAIGKILQLAVVADLEYQQAKTSGAASLLLPNNFENALAAIGQIFATPAPTPAPVTSAPVTSAPIVSPVSEV